MCACASTCRIQSGLIFCPLQYYMCKDRDLGHSCSVFKVQTLFCEMKSLSFDTKGFQIACKVNCPFPKSVKFHCLVDLFFIELIGTPIVFR
jgi:hypothetical protein